jgi:NAD kinase
MTPGTVFIRNVLVVEVVRLNENTVVIHDEISLNEVIISHNEADHLIDEYLA